MDYNYAAEQIRLYMADKLTKHKQATALRQKILAALESGYWDETALVALSAGQKTKLQTRLAAIEAAIEKLCTEYELPTEPPTDTYGVL